MLKLLLLSVVLATFLLPVRFARARSAERGLRNTVASMALAELAYAFFLMFLYSYLV